MTNLIEIKIGNSTFAFIENIEQENNVSFIKSINIDVDLKIKMIIRGRDHNPPHIHIYYNKNDFRFKFKTQEFYQKDISKNEGFVKLKSNKLLYNAIIKYLEIKQIDLINSFYFLNPTLIS